MTPARRLFQRHSLPLSPFGSAPAAIEVEKFGEVFTCRQSQLAVHASFFSVSWVVPFPDVFIETPRDLAESCTVTMPTPDSLCRSKCVPCEGGVPPLSADQKAEFLKATPGWSLSEDSKSIERQCKEKGFVQCIELANRIAELAELEQHHPDLHLTGYRFLRVVLTTHALGDLSENDFILAAKIDRVLGSPGR